MNGRFVRVLGMSLSIALVAAACDDGGGLTKAEWIEAANAICVEANDEFEALFEAGFPTTSERAQELIRDAAPIFERQVTELQELEAPDDDADEIEAILARGESAVDDLREASESPEASAEIFGAEGGENLTALEEGLVGYGAERCDEEEGEGEDEGVTRPDPATFSAEKRAFIADADAICQETNDVITPAEDELFGEGGEFPTLKEWEAFLTLVIDTNEPAQEELEALEPPDEDAEAVEALFDRFRRLLEDIRAARAAAEDGDQEAFDAAIGVVFPQFEEIERQAAEIGFEVCGIETDGDGDGDGEGEEGAGEDTADE